MTDEERLQTHLRLMGGEPIAPLRGIQEVRQALRLRHAGLTYQAISVTMRTYHGAARSDDAWRRILRAHGALPRHYANGAKRIPPQMMEGSS